MPPNRSRPRRIAFLPRNDVHMQLPHDVAQCADVEFVAGCRLAQHSRGLLYFLPKRSPCFVRQIEYLHAAGYSWHQDQPRIARVVHQQYVAQGKGSDVVRIGLESRVQREIVAAHAPTRYLSKKVIVRFNANSALAR